MADIDTAPMQQILDVVRRKRERPCQMDEILGLVLKYLNGERFLTR